MLSILCQVQEWAMITFLPLFLVKANNARPNKDLRSFFLHIMEISYYISEKKKQ